MDQISKFLLLSKMLNFCDQYCPFRACPEPDLKYECSCYDHFHVYICWLLDSQISWNFQLYKTLRNMFEGFEISLPEFYITPINNFYCNIYIIRLIISKIILKYVLTKVATPNMMMSQLWMTHHATTLWNDTKSLCTLVLSPKL